MPHFFQSALIKPGYEHTLLQEIVQKTYSMNKAKGDQETGALYTFFAVVSEVSPPKSLQVNRKAKLVNNFANLDNAQTEASNVHQQADDMETLKKCELFVYDETCSRFPVTLWNEDWIHLAVTTFIPNVTILSFVDCPVKYDKYRRGVAATPNARTVIIVAPECEEANQLSHYIKQTGNRAPGSIQFINNTQSNEENPFTQPMPTFSRRLPAEIKTVPLNSIHHIVTVNELKTGKGDFIIPSTKEAYMILHASSCSAAVPFITFELSGGSTQS
ncbi:unnamed protein product [Echinostoma caproni]|uniref:Helicase C-terminal domain-containing protein n=1 Tax=Echinostoma caproni TaxID=27848 RepID=A0A183A618_9TREM|nr:unnamed protein product [Echinostoma caproni]